MNKWEVVIWEGKDGFCIANGAKGIYIYGPGFEPLVIFPEKEPKTKVELLDKYPKAKELYTKTVIKFI